jgi:hypothetical protein
MTVECPSPRAMTKQDILAEIRRAAADNGGVPLGRVRFETETGIKESDWIGKHWASWGDAVREAGFDVNAWNTAYPDDHLLAAYAGLVRELGRVPTTPQMRMKRRSDATFPNDKVFARFGDKTALVTRMRRFCVEHPEFADVLDMLGPEVPASEAPPVRRLPPVGFVYLTKFGRHFKIGRTNAVGRRERELAIQLPEKSKTVHVIETDDPEGIEAYWHRRFAAKRANGEWFSLDSTDVAAFRRRRFM